MLSAIAWIPTATYEIGDPFGTISVVITEERYLTQGSDSKYSDIGVETFTTLGN